MKYGGKAFNKFCKYLKERKGERRWLNTKKDEKYSREAQAVPSQITKEKGTLQEVGIKKKVEEP